MSKQAPAFCSSVFMHGDKGMQLIRLEFVTRLVGMLLLLGALCGTGFAQASSPAAPPPGPQPQQFELKNYSKPRSHFPNPIGPYSAQHVSPPELRNTQRIGQLLQNGKLMLS